MRMSINQENQTKKISLLDLKYNKLRKKIGDVEIYNPDKELKAEIEQELMKRITEQMKSGEIKADIGMGEIITIYLPMLTNIEYELTDALMVQEIISNPSPLLEKVVEEVSEVLSDLFEKAANKLIKVAKSTNDILNNKDLSDEEKTEILKHMQVIEDTIDDDEILVNEYELD